MKSNLEREIYQQPDILRRFVLEKTESIHTLAGQLRASQPRFVLIAARGTSDNAATYAKYLFGALNGIPVALAMPSLYTLYDQPPDMRQGLVIGISQSGESPDVQAVLLEAKKQSVPTLAITNRSGSPMAQLADFVIDLDAGEEKSVAASKTYTAQLMSIAMLIAHWRDDPLLTKDLSTVGDLAETVLEQYQAAVDIARRYAAKEELVVVSRGYNHCTTYEIALKIKELTYMVTQAYSAADFFHGPIAILEPGFPVITVAPKGKALDKLKELVTEVQRLKADLAIISNDEDLLSQTRASIRLPAELPEWLSPIVGVIPGQLLALHLAIQKGYDPDNPRGLRKVTKTL